jgi:transketolase
MLSTEKITYLKEMARKLRVHIIKMTHAAGSGHPGGSLSSAEIFSALYFHTLNHDPKKPLWEKRDFFYLSKGHACPGLYAALAESGYFPKEELLTLRKLGSRLQGHPDMKKVPGIEVSAGSLGQGLSIAIGTAIGLKMDSKQNKVYCLLGDGELDEGQVWEAAMSASHYKLGNLCAIVDRNSLQIDGPTCEVMELEPLKEKWLSFGWNVKEINGHNMNEVANALEEFKNASEQKPTVIIAKTVKGKGVSFMENNAGWHGKATNKEETEQALKELGEQ